MTSRSSCWIVCAQKGMLRAVSVALVPNRDLNHCRSSSSRVMSAIGVPQICDARSVRSSNACSGSGSSIR